jgi:hypothetical protein
VAGVRAIDSVKVCGIRTLLPGSPGLVDPPYFGAPRATLLTFPSAEHMQECNSDPGGRDAAVENWLRNEPAVVVPIPKTAGL